MRLVRMACATDSRVWLGVAFAIGVLVSACTSGEGRVAGGATEALFERRDSPGLELRAFLSSDTIASGSPIEVLHFVVNGPTPTPFLNDPDIMAVVVELEDGTMAPMRGGFSETGSWGSAVEMTLPAFAMLGQREDLRCIRNSGYAMRGARGPCEMTYDLRAPGRYRVIVRYSPPTEGRYAIPPIADTVSLVIR